MSSDYNPPDVPLDVIHADHEMVVLSKPDGLLSVPGKGAHLADCLYERVLGAFPTALVVHRLDRDTSGVMVFGLSPHAQRFLSKQFEERRARKTYVALVEGHLNPQVGEVDLPLIVDWPNRPLQMVCHETGKPALTEYRVMRVSEGVSRVRLRPRTGRTHQLRVHMLALGHVILGDPLYAQGATADHPRMMLHSEELRIAHPESGRGMVFRSKVPF
ncbi:pseudouridine synthase [Roseovarius aestuarii]|nr:pseudouridine synthase [Roseovarius aestuarii]